VAGCRATAVGRSAAYARNAVLQALGTGAVLASNHEAWVATTTGAITVALLAGAVAALIATGLVEANATRRRRRRMKTTFGHLAGANSVRRKLDDVLLPERAMIAVNDNILVVTYFDDHDRAVVKGEIEMNEQFARSGRGHYHDYRLDPEPLWGFWEIQVTPQGEILQHTIYANPKTQAETVQGFVWEPQD
jgi:hypothetical protein